MFSLTKMYTHYQHQPPEGLQALIRYETHENFGRASIEKIKKLNKCFEITKTYINSYTKPNKKVKRNKKGEVVRLSGEPYVNHAYRVALILFHEQLLDFDLILAAIMHDLFKDTTYTYEDAKKDFGPEVADYIHCVSNYSDIAMDDLSEYAEDEKDYKLMVKLCNEHKLPFYIKFAELLDNLYTIDCMSAFKQQQIIKDTMTWLLPLVKQIDASRFETLINDVSFKINECINNDGHINRYLYLEHALKQNRAIHSTRRTLKTLEVFCKKQDKLNRVELISPTIYEIFKEMNGAPLCSFSQDNLIHKVYFIYNNLALPPTVQDVVVAFLNAPEFQSYAICKINPDGFDFFDAIGNRYKARIMSAPDYQYYRYGNIDTEDLIFTDSEELITVFTPRGDAIKLPLGSTVIDFAFAIHKEIGRVMVSATIENKRLERPESAVKDVRMQLNDGDIVQILTNDSNHPEYGSFIKWLKACRTDTAKRKIGRILRSYIEGLINKVDYYEKLLDENNINYVKEE